VGLVVRTFLLKAGNHPNSSIRHFSQDHRNTTLSWNAINCLVYITSKRVILNSESVLPQLLKCSLHDKIQVTINSITPYSAIELFPLPIENNKPLPIALGYTFQLILLLDGVRVTASLRSVDEFFSQALCDALDVAEGRFTGTNSEEGDGLVDTTERWHIDSLSSDGAGRTNTCAIFAGSAVDNCVDGDLDGVLVSHDVNLPEC
jgi:hypothetical protein